MTAHVYKHLELTGSSSESMEDAIRNAISRAARTVRDMRWFEVVETRGHIVEGEVSYWQVTLKIGFAVHDDDDDDDDDDDEYDDEDGEDDDDDDEAPASRRGSSRRRGRGR